MSPDAIDPPVSSTTAVEVPEHIVFRAFAAETVMLNLQTGTYHGLNPTAGRMLEVLQEHAVIKQAAAVIAEEYEQDPAFVEADMQTLCSGLIERGLLVVQPAG